MNNEELKDWGLLIGIVALTIVGIIIIGAFCFIIKISIKDNVSKEVASSNVTEKEITDEEIIEFAKEEIKKKLKYPETASFSKEKIIFQDEKYIVECYCTSKNGNKQETMVKFITIIQIDNNYLKFLDMITNGDTCTKDAKEIVENLIKQEEYKEIFDDWFNSVEKITMNYDKFINYLKEYPINLDKAIFEEKEDKETKRIELYIKEDGNRAIWYFTFLNGQVYNFDVILKNDW